MDYTTDRTHLVQARVLPATATRGTRIAVTVEGVGMDRPLRAHYPYDHALTTEQNLRVRVIDAISDATGFDTRGDRVDTIFAPTGDGLAAAVAVRRD